jgi:hypothetical protein
MIGSTDRENHVGPSAKGRTSSPYMCTHPIPLSMYVKVSQTKAIISVRRWTHDDTRRPLLPTKPPINLILLPLSLL